MTLRRLLLGLAILLLAALAWRLRNAAFIQDWMQPTPQMPRIEFDNGTVRKYDYNAASRPTPQGALRKCVSDAGSVTYTNAACPSGSREQGVDPGGFSVVPANQPAPAAAAASRHRPTPPERAHQP